jgi:hypothetical protein
MERNPSILQQILAFGARTDRYIPSNLAADPESFRRARLITRFGLLGSVFGLVYTLFYLLLGHDWGAIIRRGLSRPRALHVDARADFRKRPRQGLRPHAGGAR